VVEEVGFLTVAVAAENFDPTYLKVNPMGTVPSLVITEGGHTLRDSRDILKYLDEYKSPTLTPAGEKLRSTMEAIIELVHSDEANTNLVLLQARDIDEYNDKRNGLFGVFIATRQQVLQSYHASYAEHDFYGPKCEENGILNHIYTTGPSEERDEFFKSTKEGFVRFAAVLNKLEALFVLPYAVGDEVTQADLHVAPWLAHTMWSVGTKEIRDLSTLERYIQKSVPLFKFGPKTQQWWNNYTGRASFQEVFPVLH
jgi:glutathione S-transferase